MCCNFECVLHQLTAKPLALFSYVPKATHSWICWLGWGTVLPAWSPVTPTSPSGKWFSHGHLLTGHQGSEEVVFREHESFPGGKWIKLQTLAILKLQQGSLKSEHSCSPSRAATRALTVIAASLLPVQKLSKSCVLDSHPGCAPLTGHSLGVWGLYGRNYWKIQGRLRRLKDNLL